VKTGGNAGFKYNGYIDAVYAPKIEADWDHEWFGYGAESIKICITQPIEAFKYKLEVIAGAHIPDLDNPSKGRSIIGKPVISDIEDSVGKTYEIETRTLAEGTNRVTGCFSYLPLLTKDKGHWIKHCFSIDRDLGWDETVKRL